MEVHQSIAVLSILGGAHSARHNKGSVNAQEVEIQVGPIIRCKAIHNKLNVLCSRDSSRRPHHHPCSHREINGAGSSCRNQKQRGTLDK